MYSMKYWTYIIILKSQYDLWEELKISLSTSGTVDPRALWKSNNAKGNMLHSVRIKESKSNYPL